uniref:C-type lectin domain-containing protein n=1 Tax=Neogobius melanostomus TaxID=47308 RepID=A0A8C6SUQ0_9GOBI
MKLLVFSLLLCGASAQMSGSYSEVSRGGQDQGAIETTGDDTGRSTINWQTFNGRSFIFLANAVTWAHAQQHCLTLGGTLATVHNHEEEAFVKRVAGGKDAWIGLSDAQQDGFWFWINGNPLAYTNWCAGEPNNVHGIPQECVVINFSANKCWDDERCSVQRPFVCMK